MVRPGTSILSKNSTFVLDGKCAPTTASPPLVRHGVVWKNILMDLLFIPIFLCFYSRMENVDELGRSRGHEGLSLIILQLISVSAILQGQIFWRQAPIFALKNEETSWALFGKITL